MGIERIVQKFKKASQDKKQSPDHGNDSGATSPWFKRVWPARDKSSKQRTNSDTVQVPKPFWHNLPWYRMALILPIPCAIVSIVSAALFIALEVQLSQEWEKQIGPALASEIQRIIEFERKIYGEQRKYKMFHGIPFYEHVPIATDLDGFQERIAQAELRRGSQASTDDILMDAIPSQDGSQLMIQARSSHKAICNGRLPPLQYKYELKSTSPGKNELKSESPIKVLTFQDLVPLVNNANESSFVNAPIQVGLKFLGNGVLVILPATVRDLAKEYLQSQMEKRLCPAL